MRKFLLLVMLMALCVSVSATNVDRFVTSQTVSFTTTTTTPITLSSVTRNILIDNESSTTMVYVNLTGLGYGKPELGSRKYQDADVTSQYETHCVVRLQPSSSISLEIATDMIGFISDHGEGTGTVTFTATGDQGSFGR